MVQRIGPRQFDISSMMGGMSAKTPGAGLPKSTRKFTMQPRAETGSDNAVLRMNDQQQTMAVLHKAFGGDVNGPNTQNAARALGATSQPAGPEMFEEMQKMNVQFLSLQNTIQQDNRKGASLSNASKARHDNAMNSIRNLK
jgi:hypothetical protein